MVLQYHMQSLANHKMPKEQAHTVASTFRVIMYTTACIYLNINWIVYHHSILTNL